MPRSPPICRGPRAGREALAEVAELAGSRLDGLVVCAGLGPQVQPTEMIAHVNYFGALDVLDGMLPLLAEGEAPAAVVVSSNSASLTPAHEELLGLLLDGDEERACACAAMLDGATVYGMSKLALTRAMRRRAGAWGKAGVRLNAVAPGPVDTPLLAGGLEDPVLGPLIEALPVPMGRRATAAEIAAAIGFLLDPANSYIHGSVLFVDGGSDALLAPRRPESTARTDRLNRRRRARAGPVAFARRLPALVGEAPGPGRRRRFGGDAGALHPQSVGQPRARAVAAPAPGCASGNARRRPRPARWARGARGAGPAGGGRGTSTRPRRTTPRPGCSPCWRADPRAPHWW